LQTHPQIRMDIAQWQVLNLSHVHIMISRCENVGRKNYYVGIVCHLLRSVVIWSAFAMTFRHARTQRYTITGTGIFLFQPNLKRLIVLCRACTDIP
jgi:hypothetical protein